ncbi:MAG: tetratricopeptide repeat protein [Chitinophagaceae bacterium]
MQKFVPFLLLWIVAAGCNSHKSSTNEILTNPPFAQLSDSIEKDPKNGGLHYKRGVLLFENSETTLAEEDLQKAWDLQPTEEHALSLVTLLINKDRNKAIAFIEKALKILPQSVALQVSLARGYQQNGAFEKAIAACDSVLQTYPGQIDALQLKADLLKELGKDEEAMATLEKAYEVAPFDAAVTQNLAFEYAEAGNPKVLPLADSLIKANSKEGHAEPYYFKGIYYSNIGNAAEAVKQFDEAIRHNYNFMNAYINKGIVYFDQKNYAAAFKVFSLAASINPTFADAYYWMGKCEVAQNKKEDAKLNFQRAYGLDKTMTEAKEAAEAL